MKSTVTRILTLLALPILLNGEAVARHVGVRELLKRQGFGRSLDHRASIKKIGVLRYPGVFYDIYYYDYDDPSLHGIYAIIVVKNGRKYLGYYRIMPDCIVKNNKIKCDSPWGNEIVFKNGRPPKQVLIDGEICDFYK